MGAPIGFAEDGDRFDAQLAAGADDPQGNLTAIGNEDSLVHGEPNGNVLLLQAKGAVAIRPPAAQD